MGFNIINASKNIVKKYKNYLTSMFNISDEGYRKNFLEKIEEEGNFDKGPYLDVNDSFEKGKSIEELILNKNANSEFKNLDRLYSIPNLYKHQEEALIKGNEGKNLIVTTGTGSGKTECFLLPIINSLLNEKEKEGLTDGVRALIIYPMNALANDQIDRLRKLFKNYPDISFGAYTGQTPSLERDALANYKKLNGSRADDPDLREPLPNERISRDSMKAQPPHILITNYAMLEYLLLRPEDNVFFDGFYSNKWKFIVLDEAHTYDGSTGAEVSMLLRRLCARIKNGNKIQFILTSATLGDESKNNEILEFAKNLTNREYDDDSIVRAKRISFDDIEEKYDLTIEFYSDVYDLFNKNYKDEEIIKNISEKYNFKGNNNLNEFLFDILLYDKTFWKIKNFLSSPKSIKEIKEFSNFNDEEITAFVEVSSKATKNNFKLFDSRYHLFIRAVDGLFISLDDDKSVFVKEKKELEKDGQKFKVFKAVTCTQCHSLYLMGKIENHEDNGLNYLEQSNNLDENSLQEAFYIGNDIELNEEDEEDENKVEEYELCPHCGFIRSKKEVNKKTCEHDENEYVSLTKVKININNKYNRLTRCIKCNAINNIGILRGLYSGQEASTAVLATSLFQEIPEHVNKKKQEKKNNDIFGFVPQNIDSNDIAKANQFLVFSDNRQGAAYFSSYLSLSYEEILFSRIIKDVIDNTNEGKISINNFINELTALMKKKKIYSIEKYLSNIVENKSIEDFEYKKLAWVSLLDQLVNASTSRNSLSKMGVLSINFINDADTFLFDRLPENGAIGLTKEEIKTYCLFLINSMIESAAIYYEDINKLNANEKSFYLYGNYESSFVLKKNQDEKFIKSFLPYKTSNKRTDYLKRILNIEDEQKIEEFLQAFWDTFLTNNDFSLLNIDEDNHFKVDLGKIAIQKENKWYKCDKCGKITSYNIRNVCPSFRCDGVLKEIYPKELFKDSHYYRLINDLKEKNLRVVEHTAQLDKETQYKYQTLFKEQKLDVLSCSTTFEMGVDVGDLETVLLRNVPPSPSNYTQRAGRAGRSKDSAAFVLTFANKSNHDFNFFNDPKQMINGVVSAPKFKIDNEKIDIRHLYSSVLSFFFKDNKKYFGITQLFIEDVENDNVIDGYLELKNYLYNNQEARESIKNYLLNSLPKEVIDKFEVNTFGWIKFLFNDIQEDDKYPSLAIARNIYLEEINKLKEAELNASNNKEYKTAMLYKKRIENYRRENIISFLSKNNIIPKYGFPVDTITLETSKDLDLSRDLAIAILEYAPGSEVIANGNIYTSRYIKKIPNQELKEYSYATCENCKNINVEVGEENLEICKYCKEEIDPSDINSFIIPSFGFISEKETKKPSLIKPEKFYRGEVNFSSYNENKNIKEFKVNNNKVFVSYVGNDGELIVLNKTPFEYCPECGYSIEKPRTFNKYLKLVNQNKAHKNPDGYYCTNKEMKILNIGYKFKSDAIKISFGGRCLFNSKEEAYSILQSLQLAATRVLDVKNNEIAGCLYYYSDNQLFDFILYDTTPGGAGLVTRLIDESIINKLFDVAYHIAKDCKDCNIESSCYSCLRTYQNQKHHDEIKREYVINFFEKILDI